MKFRLRLLGVLLSSLISFPLWAQDALPTEVHDSLQRAYIAAPSDNLYLFIQLTNLTNEGNARAMVFKGALLFEPIEGMKQDVDMAVSLFKQAKDQGEILANYWLGIAYWFGMGAERNQVKAKRLWKESCEEGDIYSCDAITSVKNNQNMNDLKRPFKRMFLQSREGAY